MFKVDGAERKQATCPDLRSGTICAIAETSNQSGWSSWIFPRIVAEHPGPNLGSEVETFITGIAQMDHNLRVYHHSLETQGQSFHQTQQGNNVLI